jgi:hypothetical protein
VFTVALRASWLPVRSYSCSAMRYFSTRLDHGLNAAAHPKSQKLAYALETPSPTTTSSAVSDWPSFSHLPALLTSYFRSGVMTQPLCGHAIHAAAPASVGLTSVGYFSRSNTGSNHSRQWGHFQYQRRRSPRW